MKDFQDLERYTHLLTLIDAWEGGQAERLGDWCLSHLQPRSVIDIGCASGLYLLPYLRLGLEVLGVDGAPTAGQKLPPEKYMRFDLRRQLKVSRVFDLGLCLETAEHIEKQFTDIFVESVAESCQVLLWSAAAPGQGGEGHFNERPKQYWLDRLAEYKFVLHPLNDEFQAFVFENAESNFHPWLINNSLLLVKSTSDGDEKWTSAIHASIVEMSMTADLQTSGG